MWEKCKEMQDELVKMRRDLHQIPELGKDLPQTRAYVLGELEKMGIEARCSTKDSSIIAEITGNYPGKRIALRADMDALPIKEENQVDYISRNEGCMHACGHDSHTAMLLGTAKVLSESKDQIHGSVRLLFQTAEEISKGAQIMIEDGALSGVDAVFGLHIGSIIDKDITAGKVVMVPGRCMASFDRFVIKAGGIGCHGSTPEKGVDPINIAAHIVIALQEVIAREIPASKASVLTIGKIHGGNQYNIIPEEVEIEGTVRALEEDVRKQIIKRIEEISKSVAQTFNGRAEVEIDWGAPPVVNDEAMTALAVKAAVKVLGKEEVITSLSAPNMGGEDFAYYLKQVPGSFFFLSSSNHEKKTDMPHHNPLFNIDEDVLYKGSAVFVSIVEEFLG